MCMTKLPPPNPCIYENSSHYDNPSCLLDGNISVSSICASLIDDPSPYVSDVQQLDDSVNSDSSSHNSSLDYNTDDEVDPVLDPVVLAPVPNQVLDHGQPIQLEVVEDPTIQHSPLPLCMMLNARSLYNKSENFMTLLHQITPEITLVSETWERQKMTLEDLFPSLN